ncbi:MAG: magnesium/cobalt efflux protein [Coxiella sp. RIFCSPHIGHO2_12_FULL_42_15]|nr:MAG: magnesium/cobalt efflux protein [Coxiella sp. RIFCSPHIGHO2_12_FULL_42_15]
MSDDPSPPHKSWLSWLASVLHREPHDREELIEVLHNAKERQILNNDTLIMLEGVLEVTTTQVRDIMIPRGRMVVVDHDTPFSEALSKVIESTHSRFPIIGENRDEVLGILLAKDLLNFIHQTDAPINFISTLIRPAVFVPESKRIDILLHEFRNNRYHMAIVVDEFGGVSGLVTIEDVLEQIVGNIEDETDRLVIEPNINEVEPGVFDINALTSIEDFNQYFSTEIRDDDFDTMGGFIMQQIGHMPKRGESIRFNHYEIQVTQASKRRIQQLRLTKVNNEE